MNKMVPDHFSNLNSDFWKTLKQRATLEIAELQQFSTNAVQKQTHFDGQYF